MKWINLIGEILDHVSGSNGRVEVTQLDYDQLEGTKEQHAFFTEEGSVSAKGEFSVRGLLIRFVLEFEYESELEGTWIKSGTLVRIGVSRGIYPDDLHPVLYKGGPRSIIEKKFPGLEPFQKWIADIATKEEERRAM